MGKIINILSHGRFHMVDLTRELSQNGYDVKLYSFVPPKHCSKYGLRKENYFSLFWILAPFVYIERKIPYFSKIRILIQDMMMMMMMRKCDILISLTGFIYSPRYAKRKGAMIIVERGSKHILEQKRILNQLPIKIRRSRFAEDRNLEGYLLADYVSIATQHVRQSFIKYNYPVKKLFVNPYGVDLSMFKPLRDSEKKYDLIMVGGWSYRKGCDLIIDAIRRTHLSFLHVGGIVDLAFPDEQNFKHIDPVDQTQLINYYNQAKIFLMPSREEGFGMVYTQAMACNLPIVGSPDSGAVDLKTMVEKPEYITIIKDYTTDAVCDAIHKAMANYKSLGNELYAGDAIQNLTWEAYGKRYAEFLDTVIKKRIEQH